MGKHRIGLVAPSGAIAAAGLFAVALVVVGASAAQAKGGGDPVTACPSVIAACGCTITDNGVHTLTADIASAGGDCIRIKKPGATLDCEFFDITGAGSGIGVRILKGATRVKVQNCAIGGFSTGLEDDASLAAVSDMCLGDGDEDECPGPPNGLDRFLKSANKSSFDDFDAGEATGSSIVLKNSNNNRFHDFDVAFDGGDGITLIGSKGNVLSDFGSDDNGGNGVTFKNSSRNSIQGFDKDDNTGDGVFIDAASSDKALDDDADDNGVHGIEIDKGSTSNTVVFSFAAGNVGTDLVDGNNNCDKNTWSNNCFGTSNAACNSGGQPIPFPTCF